MIRFASHCGFLAHDTNIYRPIHTAPHRRRAQHSTYLRAEGVIPMTRNLPDAIIITMVGAGAAVAVDMMVSAFCFVFCVLCCLHMLFFSRHALYRIPIQALLCLCPLISRYHLDVSFAHHEQVVTRAAAATVAAEGEAGAGPIPTIPMTTRTTTVVTTPEVEGQGVREEVEAAGAGKCAHLLCAARIGEVVCHNLFASLVQHIPI